MRKKKIIMIAATVCALSCITLGFVACKDKTEYKSDEKQQTTLSYDLLSGQNITLRIGEKKTLTASTEIVEWTSDDTTIATVKNGVVTSVKEGVTFIRAMTKTGKTLSCLVNVTNVAFAPQIDLNFTARTLNVGDEWTLTAIVTVDGEVLNDQVTWSQSVETVATIDENGNSATVKAIAAGETTVYATLGNSVVACAITVRSVENTEGVFDDCAEMENAPITQLRFDDGVTANGEYDETSNVSVYPKVYYGGYENNVGNATSSLIVYATLSNAVNKPLSFEYEGYYAYGVLVSVSQSHNQTMVAYAAKTYRFYASEGANADGEYGVFIQNALDGHYLVRAFIEYEIDGEIVTEISENEVGAGDLRYEIVESADDIIVMVNDSKCMSYGTGYSMEAVEFAVTDDKNVTVNVAFAAEIPATTYYQHYNAPKFRFHTGLTKELIRALMAEGYSTLSFYTMFKTAESEYIGVNVLDEQADFSAAKTTDDAGAVNRQYVSSVVDGESNVWYYVEYGLEFLFDHYDLLFASKTNYAFMDLDRSPMTGGTFYLSNFTVNRSAELIREEVTFTLNGTSINEEIAVAQCGDVVSMKDEANSYVYTINGQTLNGEYVLAEEGVYIFAAQPKGENIVVKYEIIVGDGTTVSKLVDTSKLTVGTSDNQIYYHTPGIVVKNATYNGIKEISLKEYNSETLQSAKSVTAWSYSGKYVHYMGPQVHLTNAITKAELQALVNAGYKRVSFEYTAIESINDNKAGSDYYVLDFEKIKAMIEASGSLEAARATVEKSFTAWANTAHDDFMIKKYAYRSEWKTITYNVEDIVACYELLDLLPVVFDSFICSDTTTPYWNFYMTDVAFVKEVESPIIVLGDVEVEDSVIFMQVGALNATVNEPYVLTLNDEPFVSGTTLTAGTYTLTASSAYSDKTASVKLVVTTDLNNLSGFVDMSKLTVGTSDNNIYYATPGIIKKNATYTGIQEDVAFKQFNVETYGEAKTAHVWSYSGTYLHYMGPQMHLTSAISKEELQALTAAGYKTLSFSYTVSKGVDDNKTGNDYYYLDLEKVKTLLKNSNSIEEARATVEKAFKAYENTAHNDYMKKSYSYRCTWVTLEYNVEDLLACYEVLDLLPLFYDYIVSTEYNVYITDFTFKKE